LIDNAKELSKHIREDSSALLDGKVVNSFPEVKTDKSALLILAQRASLAALTSVDSLELLTMMEAKCLLDAETVLSGISDLMEVVDNPSWNPITKVRFGVLLLLMMTMLSLLAMITRSKLGAFLKESVSALELSPMKAGKPPRVVLLLSLTSLLPSALELLP
jgi:hypothetical protein